MTPGLATDRWRSALGCLRAMVAFLLYAYCVGVPSSRQVAKRTRVVSANQHPDHDSICEFRKPTWRPLAGFYCRC